MAFLCHLDTINSNTRSLNAILSLTGEPSTCYYYDGDGVCEDFERETSVRDCGLYTPSGFLDQWATTVETSHEQRLYCPAEVASGYPAITKVEPVFITDTFDTDVLKFRPGFQKA